MNEGFEPACRRMEWLDPFYKAVWEKAFADGIPISGTFELTPRCNFNCRMCYVHLRPDEIPRMGREMTAAEWLRIAKEAKEAGTVWLCVTGGEPLLHPEFPVIWRELSQMGFFITLQTNASLIRGETAELLAKYPPKGVKVTLYGTSDETYEQVCRIKNGFSQVDEGLKTLWELKIPTSLVSTVIRQNLDDLPRMAYYARSHGLPWSFTGGIKPSLRGAESGAREVRVTENNDRALREQVAHYVQKPLNPERKPCTYCKDYRLGYWVVWNGEMRFCSFLDEPRIPVRELPFREAWQQLLEYEDGLDWPVECKSCEARTACFKCIGQLAAESGSIRQTPPDFCRKTKTYYREVKGD